MLAPKSVQYREIYEIDTIGSLVYVKDRGNYLGDNIREILTIQGYYLPTRLQYSVTRISKSDSRGERTFTVQGIPCRGGGCIRTHSEIGEQRLDEFPQEIADLLRDFPQHIKDLAGVL